VTAHFVMVLEATIVCVDNSEWMRNGDYPPARLDAQQDAVNLVCSAKIQQNPENTVGVLTTGGPSPRVLVTATQDVTAIFSSLHEVKPQGVADVVAGVQKAQLALKHRKNQNQRQRIVVFSGSPVMADQEALVKLGKKLKKNGVAVDVVSFGESVESEAKIQAFIEAVSSDSNSHMVTVPPGTNILSDVVLTSAIISEDGGAGAPMADVGSSSAVATGDGAYVDQNLDPELAMAIRISMQEEEERQRRVAAEAAAADGQSADNAAGSDAPAPEAAVAQPSSTQQPADDDADLYGDNNVSDAMDTSGDAPAATTHPEDVAAEDDEDAQFALALELSLQQSKEEEQQREEKKDSEQ